MSDYRYDIRVTGWSDEPKTTVARWPALPDAVAVSIATSDFDPVIIEGPELEEILGLGDLLGRPGPDPDAPLWMLSFCDPDLAPPREQQRPGGPSYLGGAVVQAHTAGGAITRSHRLGINPGGEVAAAGPLPARYIAPEWRDRLLTADEVLAIPEPEELR
jgi:hypothetical protein